MSTSTVRIRPATLSDLDFIVSSNVALAHETEDLALDTTVLREGVRAILEQRVAGCYWIADVNGRQVGETMVTYEWSDWRNRMVWWIQSVYVVAEARQLGVFRTLYSHIRSEAEHAGAGGLRLYVDIRNRRAQEVYSALGMNGDHYRVFEDMF